MPTRSASPARGRTLASSCPPRRSARPALTMMTGDATVTEELASWDDGTAWRAVVQFAQQTVLAGVHAGCAWRSSRTAAPCGARSLHDDWRARVRLHQRRRAGTGAGRPEWLDDRQHENRLGHDLLTVPR